MKTITLTSNNEILLKGKYIGTLINGCARYISESGDVREIYSINDKLILQMLENEFSEKIIYLNEIYNNL